MKYLFFCSGTFSDSIRLGMCMDRLIQDNGDIVDIEYYNSYKKTVFSQNYDMAFFSRPTEPAFIKPFKAKRIPILVDTDDDFWSIPKKHVAYNNIGPGNSKVLNSTEECYRLANVVTTSTDNLKAKLVEKVGENVFVIDNGWNKDNTNWERSLIERKEDEVRIGWSGTITHREDFKLVLNALDKIIKDFSYTKIFIAGDPEIYLMLDKIPENRKLFIPPVENHIYPAIIGSFDIIITPLLDNKFNSSKSDIKLMEAGVRKIPWVASRAPNYLKWYEGGQFASSTDEWVEYLSDFVRSFPCRRRYGEAGYQKALTRESRELAKKWTVAIEMAKYNSVHEKL